MTSSRTVRIGLTGPIGCGKSTVAGWLAERGAAVVDADEVAREARRDPEVERRIVARFGSADPGDLARIVFADETALRDLEAVVHPAVRPRILASIESAERNGAPAVVIEAIKLVEGGLAELCDEVWLVTCDSSVQRDRLLGRGVPADDADRRVAAQAGLLERVRPVATRTIDTSGSIDTTRSAVDAAWSMIARSDRAAGAARAAGHDVSANELLAEFLEGAGPTEVCKAVAERLTTTAVRELTFNVHSVVLDFEHQRAVLSDDLDPTRSCEFRLRSFLDVLGCASYLDLEPQRLLARPEGLIELGPPVSAESNEDS